ncbi:hypothetical protein NAP1_13823 [Erythrobacter sp. NAP1]|uniref:OB-fold-containig protein n=1 Tax=Erythrobacter sp. NAP1 TaxID=237727 RepID=UPI00006876E9|nr:OB-fold-containig protein [Erythrobacter sp. NAP1]EAQ28682.1 hypothetical protein NAP1_13823 [Erythrobacter sp. NAP1]
MTLLEPHNLPFAGAAILLIFIALAQVIGMGDMFDGADADIDLDLDADGLEPTGFFASLVSLLGIGRVPFLIWLAILLFVFAAIGVAGQQTLIETIGAPAPMWLAAPVAAAVALPVTGVLTRPLARLLPQDETSAVGLDSLVRRDAEIQIGSARAGSPARSKVIDRHGHPHFVMVEPHDPNAILSEGETVMLVRREGETFYAVQYENPMLALN